MHIIADINFSIINILFKTYNIIYDNYYKFFNY